MTKEASGKVSVVIPCYNAERWVAETIESCLAQTYGDVEIVVVDDGSTDSSLQILERFGSSIVLEAGANRGANHARNRGLDLASGIFVKFLDADDLLDPSAIATQVACLEASGADVCYGDWRHMKHEPMGNVRTFPVEKAGLQEEVLLSLLSRLWCPQFSYLYRRDFLASQGCRWSEALRVAQDFDFILTVALYGATFIYLPGSVGTYRHHGGERVSRQGIVPAVESHAFILARAEKFLSQHGKMTPRLKRAICAYYLHLAKMSFGADRRLFQKMIEEMNRIDSTFRTDRFVYDFIVRVVGYDVAELILEVRRKIINRLNAGRDYYER